MNKEAVYDAQISPLMAQILEICKASNIAMVASFAIPTEADADLVCSSSLPDETDELPPMLRDMHAIIAKAINGRPVMMLTTTDKDGKKTLTAIV